MNDTRRIRWSSEQSRTLPERIADAVRAAIMRGDLQPGSPIHVGALARRLRVSTGPLREALRQLAGEGFVDYSPRRAVRVRSLDDDELREMDEIIHLLDSFAFRESCAHIGADALERADRLHARLRTEADPARWLPILLELRETLLEPCGRPHLLDLILTLRARTERFNARLYVTAEGRTSMIAAWRAIIDAMRTRDPGRVLPALAQSARAVQVAAGARVMPLLPHVVTEDGPAMAEAPTRRRATRSAPRRPAARRPRRGSAR